jgi:hypothetical protein
MTDNAKSTSAAPSSPPEEGDDAASARAKPLPRRSPVLPQDSLAPALSSARVINEVLYCERLLYLEYAGRVELCDFAEREGFEPSGGVGNNLCDTRSCEPTP